MEQLAFPDSLMPPSRPEVDKADERHYHLWVFEDNGTSYPTVARREDTKFRNRVQARHWAIKFGYDPKKTMTRICAC